MLAAALLQVLGGCALSAGEGPADPGAEAPRCAVCTVTFDVCRRADDYDPCLAMRRYCTSWCVSAETCEEACDGARWGCEAVVDLRRSTCDKTAAACAAHCAAHCAAGEADTAAPPAGAPRTPSGRP